MTKDCGHRRWCVFVLCVGVLAGSAPVLADEAHATPGNGVETAMPQTVADVLTSLGGYRADPTAIQAARDRIAQPMPAESASPKQRIADLLDRAAAAAQIGDQQQRLKYARAAGAIEITGGPSNRVLQEWANAEEYAGNIRESIRLREISRQRWPRRQGGFIADNAVLGETYASLGDMDAMRRLLKESEDAYRQMRFSDLWNDNEIAIIERQRGDVAFREGRYRDAETSYRKAYEAAGKDLEKNRRRLESGLDTMSQDLVVSMRDLRGAKLASTLLRMGRVTEAEWYARELIRFGLEYSGRSHPSTARSIGLLGRIVLAQGRVVEAEALSRANLKLLGEAGLVDPSSRIAAARGQIGEVLAVQERWSDAIAEFERRLDGVRGDPVLFAQVELSSMFHGIALYHAGRYSAAQQVLEKSYRYWRTMEGERGPTTAVALGFSALVQGQLGQRAQALKDLALAFEVLESQDRYQDDEAGGRFVNRLRFRWLSEGYLALLADEVAARSGPERLPWINIAFAVAEALHRSSVQKALSASAARAAIRDPALAELARQEQDTGLRIAAMSQILTEILGRPPEQRLPKIENEFRREIETLRKQREDLRRKIETEFPDYAALISPRLVPLHEARVLLDERESLMAIYPGERAAYVWAIDRAGAMEFHRSPLGRRRLGELVTRLRASVDLTAPGIGDSPPAFDFEAAHELYASLLEPVSSVWRKGESLIASVSGALSQIPLSLLVTDRIPPQAGNRAGVPVAAYQGAPWLVRQVAVSHIPSVAAFTTLRKLPAANPSRLAFVGYGDPKFDLSPAGKLALKELRRIRGVGLRQRREVTIQELVGKLQEGKESLQMPSGSPLVIRYDAIPPLPDTRDEILAIAGALGSNQKTDVFFGADASVANVMSARIDDRKIVAFATHGLLPGEFPGVNEPALALANPGNGRHGLLTLSDVLQLKLDADWVVLSACNTAAGDGEGSEAVTGLGRGFFYAGSRALLVTHWPVESRTAKDLVRGIFERYARNAALTRAEALRQSMLSMIANTQDELPVAHPAFWAPYALIGDGSRR